MGNKATVESPLDGDEVPWTMLPSVRTIGVLADVPWFRGGVVFREWLGRGLITCEGCVSGGEHEVYRPVPSYGRLAGAFLALREPEDVQAFVRRYGFLTNRHGNPRRPAQILVADMLFRAADLRDFRRLLLQSPSRRQLDDRELRERADAWRAETHQALADAAGSGATGEEMWRRARAQVPSLSVDARWRQSAEAGSWRHIARERLVSSLREMTVRWRSEPGEAIVELVATSLLQLVAYGILLEVRGDEGVSRCLECNRSLGERLKPGRPRLYCSPDPASGRDCARAAWNRSRRETRRLARL